jgi:hypothetical protein
LVPLQLALSPMCVFARSIEHPLDVPIEPSQHADPRHHEWLSILPDITLSRPRQRAVPRRERGLSYDPNFGAPVFR